MTEQNKQNIYNALVDLLVTKCDTCNSKVQLEKILLCTFKLELINFAETNQYDDVEELWKSLAKTLNVNLVDDQSIFIENNCYNGVCKL